MLLQEDAAGLARARGGTRQQPVVLKLRSRTAEKRRRALQRAAQRGVRRAARTGIAALDADLQAGPVLRSLPRRQFSRSPGAPPAMPSPRPIAFHASVPATIGRAFLWLRMMLAFVLGDLWDRLLRRSSVERRARRLHDLFQSAGGTFTKLGQQLSMRIDVLPYEYCRELAKLLESVPPMPTEHAIREIERSTGRPLTDNYAAFDPEPIGSASIACVYQAVLKTGEKVAVKVRRPGVADLFAADLRALGWIVSTAEALAIFRPGYVGNVVEELRATFMEELDFRMEAAYQTVFRREARRGRFVRKGLVSAPRVYFELSSSEVLVHEFSAGIWMWEVLAAVENKDPVALARMRELGINPKVLARRMQRANMWAQVICPIYHADPHPANIVVQRRHKLVFVDFGSCGSTNRVKRGILRDFLYYQVRRDIQGVVRSMISFMEPLPPIDLNQFEKKVEMVVGQVFHKVWSRHAPWYEKTSAALYYRLFEATRQYNLPVNVDTVRSFRASMLYDTLALRVDPTLDLHRENRRFSDELQRDRRRRMLKSLRRRLAEGLLGGRDLSMIDEVADVAARGVKAMRQELDRPRFNFVPMVEKPVVAVIEGVRLAAIVAALSGVWVLAEAVVRRTWDFRAAALAAGTSFALWAVLGALTLVTVRRVMLRLLDKKV
jgi:ubiquinone biosynthesis protein